MADVYGMAAALREIEKDNPQSMRWDGANYDCIHGGKSLAQSLGIGGYAPESALTIVARAGLFVESHPEPNDEIIVDGKTFHLEKSEPSACGSFFVFTMTDPAAGA